MDGPDGAVLDIQGCAHLFGGETGLLAQVEEDCADLGLTMRAGLADTAGAAWALAHYQRGRVWHAERLNALEEQMVAFPRAAHDDLVDAVGTPILKMLGVPQRRVVRDVHVTSKRDVTQYRYSVAQSPQPQQAHSPGVFDLGRLRSMAIEEA